MCWLSQTVITIAISLWALDPVGVLADEKPMGVVSEFATSDGSGLTHLAVRSGEEIFLGTSRGKILRWNPKTQAQSTWRKATPQGTPLAKLQSHGKGLLFAHFGETLEISSSEGEARRVSLPKASHLAISPSGRQLAAIAEEPPIVFLDPKSGKTTLRVDRQVWVDEMHYSPAGDFLASSRFGRLYLWNATSGELVWKSRLEGNLKGFVFSPDQSVLFASFGEEGIWVIDIKTGNLLYRHSRPLAFPEVDLPHKMAISPDGMLLAVTAVPDRIEIWETFTGRPILLLAKHPGTITDLAFLPDGVHLVSADESGRVYVWDLSAADFAVPFEVAKPYSEDQLRQLWRMLGEPEGHAAWSAMVALKHRPEQAMPLIQDPPQEDVLIRQLIQRLDDDEFNVRDAAFRALKQLSLHAEPFLKNTLSTSRSAEVKVRVRRLLSYLAGPRREAQMRLLKEAQVHREFRVVQLLKWIRTPEAINRLRLLADTAELPTVRQQADLALRFLEEKTDSEIPPMN